MRFGTSQLGTTQFGVSSVSGRGQAAAITAESSGAVASLTTDVGGRDDWVSQTAGRVTAHAIDTPGAPQSIQIADTSTVATLTIDTPGGTATAEIVTVGSAGDTVLTTAAKYPDLVATVAPARNIPEHDRINGYLKRPFDENYPGTQSGGVIGPGEFSDLMGLYGDVAEATARMRNDVLTSHMVDLAYGQSLDYIGGILLLPRRTGEADSHYRLRLKAYARSLTGEATVDQIRSTLALLLECDVSDIDLTEPPEPARFDIEIDQTILDEAGTTVDDVVDLVMRFRAGGVKVTLSVTGSFTHRSVQDLYDGTDLGEKGYNEATYSGRII